MIQSSKILGFRNMQEKLEKAISILTENLNSGRSYLNVTLQNQSLKLNISGSTKFFTYCCYSLRGVYYPCPKLRSQNLQQGSLGCVFPNIVAIHGENEIFFLPDCFDY